jgi:acetate kinase
MVEMGGVDVIVMTGGIGEWRPKFRAKVCEGLEELGIALDPQVNQCARGEAKISAAASRVQVWVVPTNEELIVARQAAGLLKG